MRQSFILIMLLLSGCASVQRSLGPVYEAHLDITGGGLGDAEVLDADGKEIKELFKQRAILPGVLQLQWNGMDKSGALVPMGNYQVQVFIHTWKLDFQGDFGGLGSSPGRFVNPEGLCAAQQGSQITLAIADTGNNRVQLLSETGDFLQAIGQFGLGNGMLNQPTDVDWDGQILTVCDSQNRRLVRFDSTGAYLGQVSQLTGFLTSPSNPVHLDFQDPTNLQSVGGSFWVSDPGYGVIELVTNTGGLMEQMGQMISLGNDGHFLKWPSGELWYEVNRNQVERMDDQGDDLGSLQALPPFQGVAGLGLSSDGFVLISDSIEKMLYLFDQRGKCFQILPLPECQKPGAFSIMSRDLFIIDQDQNEILHYECIPNEPVTYGQDLVLKKPLSLKTP